MFMNRYRNHGCGQYDCARRSMLPHIEQPNLESSENLTRLKPRVQLWWRGTTECLISIPDIFTILEIVILIGYTRRV